MKMAAKKHDAIGTGEAVLHHSNIASFQSSEED
jgi:hypothetical protein